MTNKTRNAHLTAAGIYRATLTTTAAGRRADVVIDKYNPMSSRRALWLPRGDDMTDSEIHAHLIDYSPGGGKYARPESTTARYPLQPNDPSGLYYIGDYSIDDADLPLCRRCADKIGGACAGPDADWRPAHAGELCGADGCNTMVIGRRRSGSTNNTNTNNETRGTR